MTTYDVARCERCGGGIYVNEVCTECGDIEEATMAAFDIGRIQELMQETGGMDQQQASEYVRQHAPDIHETPIADAIVVGHFDPVGWAREYNAMAGDMAMEYARGKVKISPLWSIVQWEPTERTVWGALKAAHGAGVLWPRAIKVHGQVCQLKHFDMESIPMEIRNISIDDVEVLA